jgi:hypothetical protein
MGLVGAINAGVVLDQAGDAENSTDTPATPII